MAPQPELGVAATSATDRPRNVEPPWMAYCSPPAVDERAGPGHHEESGISGDSPDGAPERAGRRYQEPVLHVPHPDDRVVPSGEHQASRLQEEDGAHGLGVTVKGVDVVAAHEAPALGFPVHEQVLPEGGRGGIGVGRRAGRRAPSVEVEVLPAKVVGG